MGDGILDGYPIIQDQTSPNLAHIPTTNHLIKSNDFSSNWVITGTGSSIGGSVTGITEYINGTSITLVSGGLFYSTSTPISSGVISIYMRVPSGTLNLQLGDPVGSPYETKTLTTTWQRFSTVDTGSLGGLAVYNSISGTTITIEVCAAQMEQQTQATAYLESDGIAAVRKSSTTNLLPYSEDFSTYDQIQDITLTANATTSPIGTSNATKFTSSSASGAKVRDNISVVNGTTYTFSVYCKNIDATLIKLLAYDGVTSFNNVVTSEVSTTEWTRVSVTFTSGNTTSSGQVQIARDLPNGESAFFWGAQFEEQTQAETYAKTTGLPVTIDLFTENNYGTMTNMSASDIIEDTPNN
jgi:hypothetical protein